MHNKEQMPNGTESTAAEGHIAADKAKDPKPKNPKNPKNKTFRTLESFKTQKAEKPSARK
ncbi:hypothetical protein Q4E93_29890 [Flavitalea sp. BT771]|uniref:hypothetical protein n=1 Tax=Flavitalea sp. BT771 TaxID=3063329 RepID=UPI0026E2E911|nr:hypothetical protein [Flavitalea sp. BT771]MDO6434862.1 hypothetical protein [Flavitalea sp. BT771]MDV6223762.1 hypothetical protein [Flavitalea sp. BT771]